MTLSPAAQTLTPPQMNRILVYITMGAPFEKYVEEQQAGEDYPGTESAQAFWDELVEWMAQNPLGPGQSYATVPE